MDTDADLLRRADEPEMFERFVLRHIDMVFRYITRRLGTADAEEITNDVFLTAYRRADRFRSDADTARPWLPGRGSGPRVI